MIRSGVESVVSDQPEKGKRCSHPMCMRRIGNAKNDPERVKILEARFKAVDANSDGYITLEELKAAWAKHAENAGKHQGKRPPQKEKTVSAT